MLRVSVVIPTLQKNLDLLNNLVKTLEEDVFVSEIIVIDNSLMHKECEPSRHP